MLSLEELHSITTGAAEIFEKDGYFCFDRFRHRHLQAIREKTAQQYDAQITQGRLARCQASAGIRLEFTTCGGELCFAYRAVLGGATNTYALEICLDGMGVFHLQKEGFPDSGRISYTIPASSTPQRVTVYFPILARLSIGDVCLPADFAPVKRQIKYLALGDSITQGSLAKHPNQTYANLLADMLDAELLNQAIAGVQFDEVYVDEALPFRPDLVTCSYGGNDWFAGTIFGSDKPRACMEKVVKTYPYAKIFLLLPVWMASEETQKQHGYTLEQIRQEIARVASQFPQITLVDSRRFIPHLTEHYADDRVHPNDTGFLHMAYHLYNAIKPQL